MAEIKGRPATRSIFDNTPDDWGKPRGWRTVTEVEEQDLRQKGRLGEISVSEQTATAGVQTREGSHLDSEQQLRMDSMPRYTRGPDREYIVGQGVESLKLGLTVRLASNPEKGGETIIKDIVIGSEPTYSLTTIRDQLIQNDVLEIDSANKFATEFNRLVGQSFVNAEGAQRHVSEWLARYNSAVDDHKKIKEIRAALS